MFVPAEFRNSGGQGVLNGGEGQLHKGQGQIQKTQEAKDNNAPMTPQDLQATYGNKPPVGARVVVNGETLTFDGTNFVGSGGQNASTGDPTAPVDGGKPQANAPDQREIRRQTEQTTINESTAQLDKLQAQKDVRDQRRAAATQKGHSVPTFENIDKLIQNKIKNLQDKIAGLR